MTSTYVTHARTPEELKNEVVSDLRRRIDFLYGQEKTIARSAAEKARIACATRELEDMLVYWNELQIVRPVRKRHGA